MRGVLWYQGEHNANKGHAYIYRRLFQVMIEDWRRAWGEGQFPFLFVQLANYETGPESAWPVLRESQAKALDLAATGMAVTIDIGESKDIHPKNKQEVARRLALAARAIAYKENVVYSGPIFRQTSSEGGQLRAWFDHAGAGLAARDGGSLSRIHDRRAGSSFRAGRSANRRRQRGGQQPGGEGSGSGALRLGRRSGIESDQQGRTAGFPVPVG